MKVVCEHCALPFSVARVAPGKPVYCCSGCALATRMSGGAGTASAGSSLASALGAGFLFFNQALFWMLGVLPGRRAGSGDIATAANLERLELASLSAGVLAWLTLAFLQAKAGAGRGVDRLAAAVTAFALGCVSREGQVGWALLINALFAAWALRGLARRKFPGKSEGEARRRG